MKSRYMRYVEATPDERAQNLVISATSDAHFKLQVFEHDDEGHQGWCDVECVSTKRDDAIYMVRDPKTGFIDSDTYDKSVRRVTAANEEQKQIVLHRHVFAVLLRAVEQLKSVRAEEPKQFLNQPYVLKLAPSVSNMTISI